MAQIMLQTFRQAQDSPHLQWLAVRCLADLVASAESQKAEEGQGCWCHGLRFFLWARRFPKNRIGPCKDHIWLY